MQAVMPSTGRLTLCSTLPAAHKNGQATNGRVFILVSRDERGDEQVLQLWAAKGAGRDALHWQVDLVQHLACSTGHSVRQVRQNSEACLLEIRFCSSGPPKVQAVMPSTGRLTLCSTLPAVLENVQATAGRFFKLISRVGVVNRSCSSRLLEVQAVMPSTGRLTLCSTLPAAHENIQAIAGSRIRCDDEQVLQLGIAEGADRDALHRQIDLLQHLAWAPEIVQATAGRLFDIVFILKFGDEFEDEQVLQLGAAKGAGRDALHRGIDLVQHLACGREHDFRRVEAGSYLLSPDWS